MFFAFVFFTLPRQAMSSVEESNKQTVKDPGGVASVAEVGFYKMALGLVGCKTNMRFGEGICAEKPMEKHNTYMYISIYKFI